MYFKGKKVWITGASSGIGEAMSLALAKEGAALIISARNQDKLLEMEALLSAKGATSAKAVAFDLGIEKEREEAIAQVKSLWGQPDLLILNGGLSQRSLIQETSLEVYRTLVEVDYLANVHLSKAFLDNWEQKGGGQVAVISSLVGKFGTPYRSGYSAAKHALHGFFDTLRAESHHFGLKVNIICPGFIHTQLSLNALLGNGEALGQMDRAQAEGMSAPDFAAKALRVIRRNQAEAYIGKREKLGVYVKRFFPALFRRIITKARVR